jgi:hypothetical protein
MGTPIIESDGYWAVVDLCHGLMVGGLAGFRADHWHDLYSKAVRSLGSDAQAVTAICSMTLARWNAQSYEQLAKNVDRSPNLDYQLGQPAFGVQSPALFERLIATDALLALGAVRYADLQSDSTEGARSRTVELGSLRNSQWAACPVCELRNSRSLRNLHRAYR